MNSSEALMKFLVDTALLEILIAYPDKDLQWAAYHLKRAVGNLGDDVEITPEVIKEVLKHEFNIDVNKRLHGRGN